MTKQFLFLLGIVLFVSCDHDFDLPIHEGTTTHPHDSTVVYTNPHPCSGDSVYFSNNILPFVISHCGMSGCHDPFGPQIGSNAIPYTSYDEINANADAMLYQMNAGAMPQVGSGISISAGDILMFQTWINQGKLNNFCIAYCDTSVPPTFSNVIYPIIQTNCQGCHSGNSPSGGVPLTDWTSISNAGINGHLINCLNGTNGVNIMPPNTGGLPVCVQTQISTWVGAGAPNN